MTETLVASGPECTVTDVGSTKATICETVGQRERFIGGHPMAGSEARGAEHATAELFSGATWFLTPIDETRPERYKLLHAFVTGLGAVPVAIAPRAHDRLVALTSHLPHALANQLLNQAGIARIDGHEPLAAAAGSLRDMTRVAGANPRIWVDIFLENAAALTEALSEHRKGLEALESALSRRDGDFIAQWIGEASEHRRRLLDEAYPDAGALHRLEVRVSDRPGVFARDHAGSRLRGNQHRGLRGAPPLAGTRRHARSPRRRDRRGAGRQPARGTGLRRDRLVGRLRSGRRLMAGASVR